MGDLPNLQNPEEFQQQQQQQEQEEAEEALSLCDLPLSLNNKENIIFDNNNNNNHNDNSNDSIDFFEFFSDLSYSENMCSAEDIIFCGKLIPFKEQQFSHPTPQTPTKQTSLRRRSESLSKLQSPVTRSNSINTKLMRNSRSLDYRKLNPVSNSPPETIERNSSVRSVGSKSEIALKKAASSRPRWYFFMFGMVKFPTEMELSDIKNRQVRRNQPQSMIFPVNRNSGKGSGSWKLLKALSCKDHASVAVTASFCVPRV
ncbi:hypothetical protein ACB098_01G347600 [Castanea mollissima]